MYQGKTLRALRIDNSCVELCFDRHGSAINKLDKLAIGELAESVKWMTSQRDVRGVLITSAKDSFIVGADITEFLGMFELPDEQFRVTLARAQAAINSLEDMPFPTVAAIDGFALGGGLELALAADLRVLADTAQVGLPEVNLGLFPGYGGTVRMPRLATPQLAIEWITSGKPAKPAAALAAKVVDRVVPTAGLRDAALSLLAKAISGEMDWRARRAVKQHALRNPHESAPAIEAIVAKLEPRAVQTHQPAALRATRLMARTIGENRSEAQRLETAEFMRIAKTQAASSLVQIFLSEQQLKRQAKELTSQARQVKQAAVLGAGIMGGGIACASAVNGVPALLKDIDRKQLDLGMSEARKLLTQQVSSGRMDRQRAEGVAASITPQLDYRGFEQCDLTIEAVVENLAIKHTVLREVESKVPPDAVIASNTSSLRIDDLARPLARPQNFVGMHFFNPAPVMPLVEVIRGAQTSEAALATVVGYALTMKKTPIVVKDGPGFLVNRILTPYMLAFMQLVSEGVDFIEIDRAMETFGWPMGPAYLNDVVGMDTGTHVFDIISTGLSHRLQRSAGADALRVLVKHGRLGQKSGMGFYKYESDATGKPMKTLDPATHALLAQVQPSGERALSADEIVQRLMMPMIAEAAWCLEEKVVGTPHELDMALLLGLGFPRYLGGALKYADWLGLPKIVELCDRYAKLGNHYTIPNELRAKAARAERYYAA
jgi:3-hydroxyacyl-CoA dehydrogenase / enoyl-CoA hydratase / 3-hydroxybutyryl-CoA epimerase / enoyl-CoA isomerase